MYHAGNGPDGRGCLDKPVDRRAGGDVNDGGAHLEPGVAEDFRGSIDVIPAQITQ